MVRLLRNLKLFFSRFWSNLSLIRSVLFRTKARSGPLIAALSLTGKCSTHCLMCWYHSPLLQKKDEYNQFKQELSFTTVRKLLFDLKELGVKRLFISGEGEPLNHPRIERILDLINQLGFEIFIITNITNFNKGNTDLLINARLLSAEISVHASSSDVYKEIYPRLSREKIEEGLAGFKRLVDHRNKNGYPRIEVIYAICKQNIDDLENIIKDAVKYRVDKLTLKRGIFNSELRSRLEPDPGQFEKAFEVIYNYKDIKIKNNFTEFVLSCKRDSFDEFKDRVEKETLSGGPEKDNYRFCYVPYLTTNILANGLVLSCNYDPFAVKPGNINEKPFKEIWYSKEYQDYRCNRKCETCLALSVYPYMRTIEKISGIF